MARKFYWIKLKNDFFKRHDVRIVESMPNGKDYILFYLKLLVESVSHDGHLRFSETIPYDDQMLSVVTNTNIDTVRSAVKIFTELGLMETLDDNTIYMSEVKKMTGAETEWAEKKRLYRAMELDKKDNVPLLVDNVQDKKDNVRQEKEKEKEKENKNIVQSEIDTLFESLWKLYPSKKGKGSVSKKSKKVIYDIGYDVFKQCIDRYVKYVKANEWLKYQNGSTFFNSGYIDYLDENYEEANPKRSGVTYSDATAYE